MSDYIKQLEEQNQLLQKKLENYIELHNHRERYYEITVYYEITMVNEYHVKKILIQHIMFYVPADCKKSIIKYLRNIVFLTLNVNISSITFLLKSNERYYKTIWFDRVDNVYKIKSDFNFNLMFPDSPHNIFPYIDHGKTKNLDLVAIISEYLDSKKRST
jgi:hypothetical protein